MNSYNEGPAFHADPEHMNKTILTHAITAVVVPYMGVAPINTPTEVGQSDS